jgi:hypothetical protein
MAKYQVQMDVTFSTTVEVDADSKSQAELMAGSLIHVPSDLRSHNYWHLGTDIVDIEKVED